MGFVALIFGFDSPGIQKKLLGLAGVADLVDVTVHRDFSPDWYGDIG